MKVQGERLIKLDGDSDTRAFHQTEPRLAAHFFAQPDAALTNYQGARVSRISKRTPLIIKSRLTTRCSGAAVVDFSSLVRGRRLITLVR